MPSFTPSFPSPGEWMSAVSPADSRVAIVMRTRDRTLLLQRALASVLGQSHADWRLCLVNDGGDAAAVEAVLAPHRAAFGERLTVIHHPASLGMEAASNRALAAAGPADFLAIHDDDDAWHPDFLAETVAFLARAENRRCAAVLTRIVCVQERIEEGRVVELSREPWSEWHPHMDGAQLLARNLFAPIALLIRMAVVRQIGPYNEQLPVLGDWDYNLRLFAAGDIGTLDRPLAFYHVRPEAAGAYGNSGEGGRALHQRYNVVYRNALLRAHLNADPAAAGAIMTLLRILADNREAVMRRLDAIEAAAPTQARLREIAEAQERLNASFHQTFHAAFHAAFPASLDATLRPALRAEIAAPVTAALEGIAEAQAGLASRLHAVETIGPALARLAEGQAALARRLDGIEARLAGMGFRAWWRKKWRRLRGRGR